MNLSPQQIEALDHGEAVPVVIEGRKCVMVMQEVYDRVKRVIDDTDPRDTYPAVIKAWDAYGSPDDATLYQDIE
jgi:hypothetical protein